MAPRDQDPPRSATCWADYDNQRLAWAFRAYDRFVDSLSPEVRERLAPQHDRAEAYVVVFGKTQVGKTTLLIELMGVLPQQMARVSQVLRGGRAKGQSATATTMEYRRSPDRRWGLKVDHHATTWFDDDAGITDALGQLRRQMEARELFAKAPCVVSLPIDCFDLSATQPSVRMLDLPGDKPANLTEQEHVHEMARTYVRLADLILLVGRGEDLSFLQEGTLTLPGIEDWQSAPSRFRIVTTYSFTAKSVRDLVRQDQGPPDAAVYRERLIKQIKRSIALSEDAQRPQRFFPLEFGQSWLDAQQTEPELFARVAPMVNDLKHELLAEVHAAVTPIARLRAAVDAHIVIAKVKERRLNELRQTGAALQAQLQQTRDDLGHASRAKEQATKVFERLDARLQVLSPERLRSDLDAHLHLPNVSTDGSEASPRERVTGFKICIRTRKAALSQAVQNSRPKELSGGDSAWFWRSVQISVDTALLDRRFDALFADLLATLDDYWVDRYWKTGPGSDYQRDLRTLRDCTEDARAAFTRLARHTWFEAGCTKLAEYQEELSRERAKQRSWEQFIEENQPTLEALERQLVEHQHEQNVFEQRMDADLQESRRFMGLLDSEYLTELRHRKTLINAESNPTLAFMGLLAAVQLEQVRKQVLLHVQPTENATHRS